MSKELGDRGEALAAQLLTKRGYQVNHIGGNYPVVDLLISGSTPFRVSVKTSASKEHVRLGTEKSVSNLRDDDFLMAFLPRQHGKLDLSTGVYRLLIMPAHVARDDALRVHRSYLALRASSGGSHSGNAGIMVKGYSRRPDQIEAWKRWLTFEERWDLLPAL
jgi:hypothetical protein